MLIPSGEVTGNIVFTAQPAGSYTMGDLVDVCWTISGMNEYGDGVEGALLLDGGRQMIDLGAPLGDNCYEDVHLPWASTNSARFVLEIYGSLNRAKYFYGNYFTIRPDSRLPDAAPTVSLTGPAAGAAFAPGALIPITWNAADNEALRSFDIQASYDGGRSWHVIAQGLPATDRGFNWQTAPGTGFADVRLRVVAFDRRFQDTAATVTIRTNNGGGGGSGALHSGDLDGRTFMVTSKAWRATVTVLVENAAHAPVAGVTVSGAWSGGFTGTGQCVTGATGACNLTSGNIRLPLNSSVTFTVNNLVKAGYSYNTAANHDPDGSSNGRVIVVNRP
jgi:hypothetical protein